MDYRLTHQHIYIYRRGIWSHFVLSEGGFGPPDATGFPPERFVLVL